MWTGINEEDRSHCQPYLPFPLTVPHSPYPQKPVLFEQRMKGVLNGGLVLCLGTSHQFLILVVPSSESRRTDHSTIRILRALHVICSVNGQEERCGRKALRGKEKADTQVRHIRQANSKPTRHSNDTNPLCEMNRIEAVSYKKFMQPANTYLSLILLLQCNRHRYYFGFWSSGWSQYPA